MATADAIRGPDRSDAACAALVGTGSLLIYTRTLAPDVLYSDSAEFQTLAYTLGDSHSTGYPIYLLLARLVGLLPIASPAWRINFLSACMAALTVAGVYLLARTLTGSRVGAVLASLALALSYTLWSQAVIAEVYTPGSAFLVWAMFLVARWRPGAEPRNWALFTAALLLGLALGVHATTVLAAPVAAAYVLLRLTLTRATSGERRHALLAGLGGASLGVAVWLVAFLCIDRHDPASSFIRVTLEPNRSIWNLSAERLSSPLERLSLTLNSVQWKDDLFRGGGSAARDSAIRYLLRVMGLEFSGWYLLLGLGGIWAALRRARWEAGYVLVSYLVLLCFAVNYHPSDPYVFFLCTYVALTAFAGAGAGSLIGGAARARPLAKRGLAGPAAVLATLAIAYLVLAPTALGRLAALRGGAADFVTEEFAFPVSSPREPRTLASRYLEGLPEDAVVLMQWRALYSVAYLAYVEGRKPGIRVLEAMPRGNDGAIAASMMEEIRAALRSGRPVFAQERFPGLEEFDLRVAANGLWAVR